MAGRRILCIGLTCLDVISVVEAFPEEDSDTRCISQRWQRGGNASNSSTVLVQLEEPCTLLSTFAPGHLARYLQADAERCGVQLLPVWVQGDCPSSVVLSSLHTGSRTIVHSGKLSEVSAKDFESIDLLEYKWVHLEARAGEEQACMLRKVDSWNKERPPDKAVSTSVELEKPYKLDTYQLLGLADVVFISKEFAKHLGHSCPQDAVQGLKQGLKSRASLVCPWAEFGAWALDPDGQLIHSPAFPPPCLVDTLGAGDTFIAGVIHILSSGASLQEAITFGCKLAGRKCGMEGYDGLTQSSQN
uniref:ketohexokinase n=1 Tax=Myxine glutinosa TaxID=7769 RepID=UPI00358EA583